MKKIIAFLLVAVMCLSFVACGKDKSLKEEVVGTWIYVHTNESGNETKQVLEIYEGGTAEFNSSAGVHNEGTWKIKDGVLNYEVLLFTRGFSIDTSASPMTLTDVSDEEIVFTKAE